MVEVFADGSIASGNERLDAALRYASSGWIPVPVCLDPCDYPPHNKDGKPCSTPGKHPLVKWKYRTTVTMEEIREWWSKWPWANVAILTGARSGLVVIDIDGDEGWFNLTRLRSEHGDLPATYTVKTRRGRHLYYKHPGGKVQNRVGKDWRPFTDSDDTADGLDVRGDGGLVIAPPSVRKGVKYEVAQGYSPGQLGDAWVGVLTSGKAKELPPAEPKESASGGDALFSNPIKAYTREEAEAEVAPFLDQLREAPNGSRNKRLNDAAIRMGHFVPAFWSREEAATRLHGIAEETGLDNGEIVDTIASGLSAGMAEPYELSEDEDEAEEPKPDSLQAEALARLVDLGPYLDGTYAPPVPSVGGERSDGKRLMYPGRWHTVIALTAAGKSWYALWHTYVEMMAGNVVVYLHFEESTPALTLGRLRALGVPDEVIRERFRWVSTEKRWTPELFAAVLDALPVAPTLVVVDGINAMCSQHGWPVNEPAGVGAFRQTFEKPATKLGAAVLSLGHPPKALDRQNERHGFGSTAWLDEVDGVGFRLVATRNPIRRRHRGASKLYSVKDRDDQVQQHGLPVADRDGWWFLGMFTIDDTTAALTDYDGEGDQLTSVELLAPTDKTESADTIETLAEAIVDWMAKHDNRFGSQATLVAGLRSAGVKYDDGDVLPALLRLVDNGRIEYPETGRGRARPGWLTESARADSTEVSEGD